MQGPRTHDAMMHAELAFAMVWTHFLNMGGAVGELELDAYLHGLMPLALADRDCVAQAVNELLDDRERSGTPCCCRAPYNAVGAARAGGTGGEPCSGRHDGTRPAGRVSGTAERPVQRPWRPQPVRRAWRPEA